MRLSIAGSNCGRNVAEPRLWPVSPPRANPISQADEIAGSGVFLIGEM
jgi:hypothetical protein